MRMEQLLGAIEPRAWRFWSDDCVWLGDVLRHPNGDLRIYVVESCILDCGSCGRPTKGEARVTGHWSKTVYGTVWSAASALAKEKR